MWFGCAQRADGVVQTGKDYTDMEGLCYKMAFNYEMAKHPDPFTEAKGYNGPVLLLRADDDRLVDEGTCSRYAQVYTAPEVDTIAGVATTLLRWQPVPPWRKRPQHSSKQICKAKRICKEAFVWKT